MGIKHSKTSPLSNNGDPNLVQPSDWNADHIISGPLDLTGANPTTILDLVVNGRFGLLPNVTLTFSSTPTFDVTHNASYTMVLAGNVTGSSTIGTPINGSILSLTLVQDSTGGRTFVFPANFILPVGFAFDIAATDTNALTFKYDGTNWNLIATGGGAAGTGIPNGNTNDLQKKQGSNFAASSINDDGTTVKVANDLQFKGTNPWRDIRSFGARATSLAGLPTTTCTMGAASTTMTLGAASTFQNGDGIVCRGAGATLTLSTPTAPTVVAGNATGPTGTGQSAANATGATTYQYQVMAENQDGSFTPASTVTSIANGPATLGAQATLTVTSWTQAANVVNLQFSAPHNMVVGTYFVVQGETSINGWYTVAAVPDNTHISYLIQTDTRLGALAANGASTANVIFWMSNHVTWPEVTGAMRYYVYGRTAGAMNLIWVSHIQSTSYGMAAFAGVTTLANVFDDYGATLCPNIASANVPDYIPLTPPVSGKNGDLVTTIVNGAGTTTLLVANASTNAVAGTVAKLDNAPNIRAAIGALSNGGSIYIPTTGGIGGTGFITNSVIDINTGINTSIIQAGILFPNAPIISRVTLSWTGQFPLNPLKSGAFAPRAYPLVQSGIANPFVYAPNSPIFLSYLTFVTTNPTLGSMVHVDKGGSIPGFIWENLNFITTSGASDYMTSPVLLRQDSSGGSNYQFKNVSIVTGPTSPVTGTSSTPAFLMDGVGNPLLFSYMTFNKRNFYIRVLPQGLVANFEYIYDQQGITPFITVNNPNNNANSIVTVRNYVLDTMGNPLYTEYGTNTPGLLTLEGGNFPGSGMPLFTSETGLISKGFYLPTTPGASTTQFLTALEGSRTNSISSTEQSLLNAALLIGPSYQAAIGAAAQPAPSLVVQAGGSISIGTHLISVAPVFPTSPSFSTGGEGQRSQNASATTSGGNQTIQITWTAVPGAVGYDLYDNNFSIGCFSGLVTPGTATSFTWNGGNPAPCGISAPTGAGSGPVGMTNLNVWAPKVTVSGNGFKSDITAPTLTTNRTFQLPDANVLPLSLGVSDISYFTGASVASFTNLQNTIVSSSNQFTGGTAGAWNAAAISAGVNPYGFGNDQAASITLGTIGAGNAQVMACVRLQAGVFSGYCAGINTNSNTYFVQRFTAGSPATIASSGITAAVGDYVTIKIVGTTITTQRWSGGVLVNNTSNVDANFSSGTPGVAVFSNTSKGVNLEAYTAKSYPILDATQDWPIQQNFPAGITLGSTLGTLLTTTSGTSGRVGQTSGTLTSGHGVSIDANANLVDSGLVSGTNPLSGILAATGANSINNGDNAQTWNWALTTAAKTAFGFTENTAAINGAGNQFLGSFSTIAGSTAVPLAVSNSLTGTQTLPALSITPTWNTSGVVDAALFINPTNTGSGTGSLLIDAKLGGTSQWKVDKAGNVSQLGVLSAGSTPPACTAGTGGAGCLNEGTAPSAGANYDTLYANSADHMLHQNLNNGGDLPLPNRQMLTSTYTNATTTASNITGLAFTVAANANYAWHCDLYYQGSASTAGLDITITGPAAATSVFYSYDEAPTATTTQDSVASAFSTKLTGNATITATTNFHAVVTMGLRNGANAGTIQLQGSATGAGTVTVQAGSYCVVA